MARLFDSVPPDVKNLPQRIRRQRNEKQKHLAQQKLAQRQKPRRGVHQNQREPRDDGRQGQNAHDQMRDPSGRPVRLHVSNPSMIPPRSA